MFVGRVVWLVGRKTQADDHICTKYIYKTPNARPLLHEVFRAMFPNETENAKCMLTTFLWVYIGGCNSHSTQHYAILPYSIYSFLPYRNRRPTPTTQHPYPRGPPFAMMCELLFAVLFWLCVLLGLCCFFEYTNVCSITWNTRNSVLYEPGWGALGRCSRWVRCRPELMARIRPQSTLRWCVFMYVWFIYAALV